MAHSFDVADTWKTSLKLTQTLNIKHEKRV